ncbi:Mth938-like domain-containing protein [Magnetospirillum sulfuroxidans]|uniref:Mth938-like domain-containing protein n=1 Tax=Magnetospirillum sulfuroxidans TaxID=611300 RepID=A0ABS5I7V0_9PROT|nr:Mth938-like domain-containing protein [Magnetospirillum sulfuroxidans]MBR9970485.1 Mth938-like domain-containing protein [Magnetospirillum sulfuroxidans]
MDITPVVGSEFQLIGGYGDGGFTVSGTRHEGSVLILPRQTHAWPVTAIADITLQSLDPLLRADPRPTILVLGCGRGMTAIAKSLRDALRHHGIVVEPMDSGAACRTYNVLLTEGRDVAAAIIAV